MNDIRISKTALQMAAKSPILASSEKSELSILAMRLERGDISCIFYGDGEEGAGFYTEDGIYLPTFCADNDIAIAVILYHQAHEERKLRKITPNQLVIALDEFSKTNPSKYDRLQYGTWRSLIALSKSPRPDNIWYWHQPRSFLEDEDYEFMFFTERENSIFHLPLNPKFYGLIASVSDHGITSIEKTEVKENNQEKKEKENKTMNIPTMKFDFGPIRSNEVSLSPYGMAIRTPAGQSLAYNAATGQTVDVTGMTFDFKGMIYKVPVAINAVVAGDMVMHNGKPMYVTAVNGTNLNVIDILESEAKNVIPVTNMFGFNFVTKVVSFINFGANPTPDQPFGNLMPIMMASMVFGEGETPFGGDMDFGKMMMLSMMMGGTGGNPFANMFNLGMTTPAPAAPAVPTPPVVQTPPAPPQQ
ncbi:MAG: hypothetical protein K2O54_03060 [Prevotella sp.]|nr:hypothetical protein [Prevotella sp.]